MTFRRIDRSSADQTQQRVAADRHGQPMREARTGLTSQGKADVQLGACHAQRPPSLWSDYFGQALGEDGAGTLSDRTAEPPSPNTDLDNPALPGQVRQTALIGTVNTV